MSESDTPSHPVHRTEEERAAFFADLMRTEQRQNRPPVSGLAVASLGFAIAFTGLAFVVGVFSLVVGAAAFVFGVFALPQIRHRERRGLVFVLLALAVLVCGAVLIETALDLLDNAG